MIRRFVSNLRDRRPRSRRHKLVPCLAEGGDRCLTLGSRIMPASYVFANFGQFAATAPKMVNGDTGTFTNNQGTVIWQGTVCIAPGVALFGGSGNTFDMTSVGLGGGLNFLGNSTSPQSQLNNFNIIGSNGNTSIAVTVAGNLLAKGSSVYDFYRGFFVDIGGALTLDATRVSYSTVDVFSNGPVTVQNGSSISDSPNQGILSSGPVTSSYSSYTGNGVGIEAPVVCSTYDTFKENCTALDVSSTATLAGDIIAGNSGGGANPGSGVTFTGTTMDINDCIVSGNAGSAAISATPCGPGSLTIRQSEIDSNTAGQTVFYQGCVGSSLDVYHVSLFGNTAANAVIAANVPLGCSLTTEYDTVGGNTTAYGISVANSGSTTLTSTTVANNTGVGVSNTGLPTLSLKSDLVAQNQGGDTKGTFLSLGSNYIQSPGAGANLTGKDRTGGNAGLAPRQLAPNRLNIIPLYDTSPAAGFGAASQVGNVDNGGTMVTAANNSSGASSCIIVNPGGGGNNNGNGSNNNNNNGNGNTGSGNGTGNNNNGNTTINITVSGGNSNTIIINVGGVVQNVNLGKPGKVTPCPIPLPSAPKVFTVNVGLSHITISTKHGVKHVNLSHCAGGGRVRQLVTIVSPSGVYVQSTYIPPGSRIIFSCSPGKADQDRAILLAGLPGSVALS